MLGKWLLKFFTFIFFLVKRKKIDISAELGFRDLFTYFISKGGMPLVRGVLIFPFIHSKGLIFLGKAVQISYKHKFFVGKSCYVGDYSIINCLSKGGVHFGNYVTVREFAWVQLSSGLSNPGERIFIGDHTYIGPYSKIGAAAPITIGKFCQIGANVSFIAENHQFEGEVKIFDQSVSRKGITIGDDCWIGNNVTILDGVNVGSGCVIGAGAVVNKSIPDKTVAVGVPAKVIRKR